MARLRKEAVREIWRLSLYLMFEMQIRCRRKLIGGAERQKPPEGGFLDARRVGWRIIGML